MGNHVKKTHRPVQNPVRRFFNTPKGYVLVTLIVTMAIAAMNTSDRPGVDNVGIAVLTALILDFAVAVFRRHRGVFSDGGAVTGLIVGLVLSSATPWYATVLTTAIAILSKHLLKSGRKPILNPAAVGLLLASFLFTAGQSWWGDLADLPIWCVVLLLVAGYFVVDRVNKFPQVLSFLGGYFFLILVAGYFHLGQQAFSPGDALRNPLVNSAFFMAFFMLTDPPTSPGKYKDQVLFGLIAAAVSVAVYIVFGGLAYLLIGLLVANVWKAWRGRQADRQAKKQAVLRKNAIDTSARAVR